MLNALVPIDGSPVAMRALEFALQELRGRTGARVQLLNVQAPPIHPWPGKLVSPDMIAAELHSEGEKLLSAAQNAAQAAGVACVLQVSIGAAAEEIVARAVRSGCDAIVMGTRGMGAVKGFVLGAVAQKVVHLAPMPVTLVK